MQRCKGFTLIELMVTIAIVAILSTVGIVVYSTAQKTGRISKRAQDLHAIKTALELFKSSTGFYPSVGVAGNFVCLNSLTGNNSLAPNYMPLVPTDPSDANWCYLYTSDGVGGAAPTGTAYKVYTSNNIPTTEMGPNEYRTQPALIDPDRDGTADDNCTVTTTGVANYPQAWAVHSGSPTACNY